MTSNIFYKCHLSNPILKKKDQTKEEFINERKKYFDENIKNLTGLYNGLPVILTKRDEPGDACFEKFAIGGENYHKTMKVDLRRLERFDWIFEIINRIDKCKECGYIKIYKDPNFSDRTDIECEIKKYKVVIVIVSHEKHYEIISAFIKK